MNNTLFSTNAMLILSVLGAIGMILPCYAITSAYVFPPDSKPYGHSYEEWSAEWWKWLATIPGPVNPSNDNTGEFCASNQNTSGPVWYLAGTSGGPVVTRNCTIPEGKSILISPIEVIFTLKDDQVHPKNEDGLRSAGKADQDSVQVENIKVKVNDVDMVSNFANFRFQSPIFNITLPENNIANVPAGLDQAASDGYFVMLKPLPAGTYKIESKGESIDPTGSVPQMFASHVIYNITVK